MSAISKKAIALAFAASAWGTCTVAQAPGPTISSEFSSPFSGKEPSQNAAEDELARRLYQAQLKQAFLKDPYLYQSLLNVMGSPNGATVTNEIDNLENRKKQEEDIINGGALKISADLPLSGITGLSVNASRELLGKERSRYLLNQQRAHERSDLLSDMTTDEGNARFNQVTNRLKDLAYAAKNGLRLTEDQKIVVDFYEKMLKPKSQDFPAAPGNLSTMVNSNKDLSETLNKAGYTPAEVRDVLNGKRTLDQIDNPKAQQNLTSSIQVNVKQTLIQQINVRQLEAEARHPDLDTIHNKMGEIDALLGDKSAKLTPDDIKKLENYKESLTAAEKAIRIERHEAGVRSARDWGGAVTNVAALFNSSPEIQRASQAYNAGLNIYDAVGRMIINNALDPTGISAIAGGIGVISNLFGPKGPSAESIMMGMLNEVLKLQREILKKLDVIDRKIDVLDRKLDIIIDKLDHLDENLRNRFMEMRDTFIGLARQGEEQNRVNIEAVLQKLDFADARADIKQVTDLYQNPDFKVCLASATECTPNAEKFFQDMAYHTTKLEIAATHDLTSPPYFIDKNISKEDETSLRAAINYPVESRAGQMESTAAYLNGQITPAGSQRRIDMGAVTRSPDPYFLTSKYIPLYAEMITHLPRTSVSRGTLDDIQRLKNSVDKVANIGQELRRHIELARTTFVVNAFMIARRSQDSLYAAANKENLSGKSLEDGPLLSGHSTFPETTLTKLLALPAIKTSPKLGAPSISVPAGVLFGGYNADEMGEALRKLSDVDFEKLGLKLGVFSNASSVSNGSFIISSQRCENDVVEYSPGGRNMSAPSMCYSSGTQTHTTNRYITLTDEAKKNVLNNPRAQLPDYLIAQHIQTNRVAKTNNHVTGDSFMAAEDKFPGTRPKERKIWEDIIVTYVQQQQEQALARTFRTATTTPINYNLPNLRTEMARARLAMDTFLKGGYGECLDSDPRLEPLRQIQTSAANIDGYFRSMETATNVPAILNLQNKALEEIQKIASAPLPNLETTGYESPCQLGWGRTDDAMAALNRAENYVRAQIGPKTNAPQP